MGRAGGNHSYKGLLSEQMFWPGKDVIRSSWKETKSLLDEDLISLTSERAHLEDRSVGTAVCGRLWSYVLHVVW